MQRDKARILVVDDEEPIQEVFSRWLSQAGYECATAGSADDAELALKRGEFDLMLLDLRMPGKSGLAYISEVAYRYPDMAVVMVTGQDDRTTAVLAMQQGAYDFLTKPVPLGLLALQVGKTLNRRALLLDNKAYHVGDKAFDVEGLEKLIPELNLRLGQAKRERAEQANREASGTLADAGLGLEIESLSDIAQGIGDTPTAFIKTGEPQLDEKLGGGLPRGSLTLIEGSSSTGKSVLCQQLMYGSLMTKGGVVCYSSEFTFNSLLTQMHSIGLDASECPRGAQLTVVPLEDPTGDEDADPLLTDLILALESVPDSIELVVIDAITNLASYSSERSVLSFFSACKRMCAAGRTIIVVTHSSTFDERMFVRLRAMCDGYLSLKVENIGEKLMNSLEVRKILNAERATGNVVFFEVEPGVGMRVNPFSRAKV